MVNSPQDAAGYLRNLVEKAAAEVSPEDRQQADAAVDAILADLYPS